MHRQTIFAQVLPSTYKQHTQRMHRLTIAILNTLPISVAADGPRKKEDIHVYREFTVGDSDLEPFFVMKVTF